MNEKDQAEKSIKGGPGSQNCQHLNSSQKRGDVAGKHVGRSDRRERAAVSRQAPTPGALRQGDRLTRLGLQGPEEACGQRQGSRGLLCWAPALLQISDFCKPVRKPTYAIHTFTQCDNFTQACVGL